MPTPHENESRDDFISRCIPIVLEDETAQDHDQAVAICNSMWEEAGKEQDKMERKTFSGFVTKADADQGVIETVFAVFGNIDKGDDVIHPGAFTKTFAERGGKVRVLDAHRTDSVLRAIGKPLMFKEVSRKGLPAELLAQHPEATGGAFASVQMLMDTPEGKGAFIRLKEGAIDEWSFGYDALDVDFSQAMKDGKEITVRNLRTLKLYEISPVLFGMNEATTTVSAKADENDKTVSGATNLPIADRTRAWNASAAVGRVRSFTGSTEEPSSSYKNAFFWFDGDEPDNFGSYKLPFADVVGGHLTAIPRGIFAGAAVMQGARGGADVGGDADAVKARIATYYGRMRRQFDDDSIVAPWNKVTVREVENKAINLSQRVPDVCHAFYAKFPDIHNHNHGMHIVYWVEQVWDEFVIIEQEGTLGRRMWKIAYSVGDDNDIEFSQQSDWMEVTIAFVPIAPATMQVATDNQHDDKAGPEAPPTSSVLDEITLLEFEIELLEASYEFEE